MLFTDGDWLTPNDLSDEDSKVTSIAEEEGIDVPTQIRRAIDECGTVLLNDLKQFSMFPASSGLTPAHQMAVLNVGGRFNANTRVCLQHIVVTPQDGQVLSPLRMWALNVALLRVFRGALNNNLADSYANRVDFIEKQILNKYWPRVFNDGLPIVYLPLSRPAASRDFWATGTWVDGTNATSIAGPAGTAGDWVVCITFVDQTTNQTSYYKSYNAVPGQTDLTGNAESAPSDPLNVQTDGTGSIRVDITSLYPPLGKVPLEVQGVVLPRAATGWNVYCCQKGGANILRLQNAVPIPIATKTFTFASGGAGFADITSGQRRDDKMMLVKRFARV